ncbi:hypothetical protein VNO80_24403 [Phaseolus coccineus]|uniref:Uncharacterized protein n=1 Tax=Phaseolus coccineus TaxID=3886 RepID=A0AAN9LWM5_PHACN
MIRFSLHRFRLEKLKERKEASFSWCESRSTVFAESENPKTLENGNGNCEKRIEIWRKNERREMHRRRGADLRGQFGPPKRIEEERIELMDDETRALQIYNAMRIWTCAEEVSILELRAT